MLGGCAQLPGLDDHAGRHIGHDVAQVREHVAAPRGFGSPTGWQEKAYRLDNGHWVCVEPYRRHCEIHYEVNGQDTVVGYTPMGAGCRYR